MDARQFRGELEAIKSSADFGAASSSLVDRWSAAGVGLEAVVPILQFMESHPGIEYGKPGRLVHFVERFYGHGYEDLLVESVARHPTWITVWMLNRLINGTQDLAIRRRYVRMMMLAAANPQADQRTIEQARHFLTRL